MFALKNYSKPIAVLIVVVVLGAYLVASNIQPETKPTQPDWLGISVHFLSISEARLVNESGARWIRIDASENLGDFGVAVKNAKAYNLSVLAILDSWMFNKSTVFTLDDWRGNITHYVSQYADYVDAWEIWNEPANPNINNTLLHLQLPSQENMTKIVDFYYSMAQTAYPIIRQYDPTAKILLFGGLNLYSAGEKHLPLDENFSSQLAAKGIEQYGDAISVHAYPWMNKTEPRVWDSYTQSLEYYRGLFTKSLDVWVTETGKKIQEDGEDGQTRYMADALEYFHQQNVTRLFWYSLVDNAQDLGSFGLS